MGSNPRNSEFPAAFKWDKPDEVGRPADEDPNWVGPDEWRQMQTDLMRRLSGRKQVEKKKYEKIPTGATHKLPKGHIFWFTPISDYYDEVGWRAKKEIFVRRKRKGVYEVVSEGCVEIKNLDGELDYLCQGDIIYTTRVKKLKKTTY